jgi:hypothetical protein
VDKKRLEKFDVEGRKPNAMGGDVGIMTVADKKPEKKFDAEFYKNSIRKDIKDYSEEGMTKRIGPFTFGYMLDSLNRFVEEGGDKDTAKQLQTEIQNFINFHAETFQSLPEDERKEFEEKIKTDFIEDRGIIPGLPYVPSEEAKDGGRIGFDKGSPPSKGRRNFLKLLGGLASIPVFGKLFKAAKPAAKVAEVAKEVTSGVPAYFPKLVEKIKMLGNDVTEKAATVERQKVIDYKDYTLTEDITTGAITIDKRTEGGGMYQIGEQMEYESGIVKQERIEYTPPETIMGKDGKPVKVPAQYEEVTVKPDFEGKMKDVESGLDSYDEILEEVGETKIKKSGGGVAYMLGE